MLELELSQEEIEYVVARLSVRSLDLRRLNYKELAEIFVEK